MQHGGDVNVTMNRTWRLSMMLVCSVMLCGCPPVDPSEGDENKDTTPQADMAMPVGMDMPTTQADMAAPPVVLPPGQDISIASFNVELLFDENCDSTCGDGKFEEVIDPLELNSRITRIQRAIQKIDADVIVLQEIEKSGLLDRVVSGDIAAEYPTHVFGEAGYAGSLDVAIISRGSLVKTVLHRDKRITTQSGGSEQFARELIELHLDIKGVRVIAFGAHFISKASDNSAPRRWAEANASGMFAAEVAAANPAALVVVAGDLNDTIDSSPLLALAAQGLSPTAAGLDPNTYYTHSFRESRQIIDHIFYVPAPNVVPHPDGLTVLRDDGRNGLANSDHASPRQVFRVGN
jgi:endonuclease/exonuclease/phosphatase family metal-dependent hydrolase